MSSRFFVILFLAFSPTIAQQNLSGKIIYKQTTERNFRGNTSSYTERWELVFTDSLSICHWLPLEKEERESEAGGMIIRTMEYENKEIFETDLQDRKVRDVRELLRKYFLVKDDFLPQKWKITGKQVLVENYPCMEAVLQEDTVIHRAWFAPQLKLPIGPGKWRGLPGMILYMELDNGRTIISVESMDLEYKPTAEDFEVEQPEISDTMDWPAFETLYDKKMAERRSMYGR